MFACIEKAKCLTIILIHWSEWSVTWWMVLSVAVCAVRLARAESCCQSSFCLNSLELVIFGCSVYGHLYCSGLHATVALYTLNRSLAVFPEVRGFPWLTLTFLISFFMSISVIGAKLEELLYGCICCCVLNVSTSLPWFWLLSHLF